MRNPQSRNNISPNKSYQKFDENGKALGKEFLPSAVSAHCMIDHDLKSNFDLSIAVLGVGREEDKRKALEAMHIRTLNPELNRRIEGSGTVPL